MQTNIETLGMMVDVIKEEKRRIIEELYDFQKIVSQFPTVNECASYNRGLRDFADKLQEELDD
jgi:hypothetical protein